MVISWDDPPVPPSLDQRFELGRDVVLVDLERGAVVTERLEGAGGVLGETLGAAVEVVAIDQAGPDRAGQAPRLGQRAGGGQQRVRGCRGLSSVTAMKCDVGVRFAIRNATSICFLPTGGTARRRVRPGELEHFLAYRTNPRFVPGSISLGLPAD